MAWELRARTEQLPTDEVDWLIWMYLAGRGTGKTRSAGEWLVRKLVRRPGSRAFVSAPTFGDTRKVCIEGESGLLGILRRYRMLRNYNRSTGEVTLRNDSTIDAISGEEADRFRGPQFHYGWFDELAAFAHPESFDLAMFTLRLGEHPQLVVTTTPRPVDVIRKILARDDGTVRVVRGKTADNLENLPETFLRDLELAYGGTRLWRQEALGELLEDVPGALWTPETISRAHELCPALPTFQRVVIAIDPAITATETSDETGIVVAGRSYDGMLGVIADYTRKDSPLGWAKAVVEAYRLHDASLVVYEKTQGGDAWRDILHTVDPYLPVQAVDPRGRSKRTRAEPVAALYEQGKVFHVEQFDRYGRRVDHLGKLEDQLISWAADDPKSPDRLDAMVYAIAELAGPMAKSRFLVEMVALCPACETPNPRGSEVCSSCGRLLSTGEVPQTVNLWGVKRG